MESDSYKYTPSMSIWTGTNDREFSPLDRAKNWCRARAIPFRQNASNTSLIFDDPEAILRFTTEFLREERRQMKLMESQFQKAKALWEEVMSHRIDKLLG